MEKKYSILNLVKKKDFIIRITIFLVACFFVALNYNMIFVANNLVIGGMSGLGIVIKELTGLSTTFFLYISTAILTVVSCIFLDKKATIRSLFGSMCFSIMVSITAPLVKIIDLHFESMFIMILFSAIYYGIFYGIIYRTGFNTGGSDTITLIVSKYGKLPMGTAGIWTNFFIIIAGFIVFGPTKTVYSIFILLLGNIVTNIVLMGIKDSKMCYIVSDKSEDIEKYLMEKVGIGVTEIDSRGGLLTGKRKMLFVIVSIDKYYGLKHLVKKMDENAFILTSNCYAVSGGYKKDIIPF